MRSVIVVFAVATLVAVGTACADSSGQDGEVVGIVTEVTGDLSGVESFVVLDGEGNSFKFTPRNGLLVLGAPPSHLRDHVISGEPVKVVYHEDTSGELIADEVTDAGA